MKGWGVKSGTRMGEQLPKECLPIWKRKKVKENLNELPGSFAFPLGRPWSTNNYFLPLQIIAMIMINILLITALTMADVFQRDRLNMKVAKSWPPLEYSLRYLWSLNSQASPTALSLMERGWEKHTDDLAFVHECKGRKEEEGKYSCQVILASSLFSFSW
jgi:hypothetical protein